MKTPQSIELINILKRIIIEAEREDVNPADSCNRIVDRAHDAIRLATKLVEQRAEWKMEAENLKERLDEVTAEYEVDMPYSGSIERKV